MTSTPTPRPSETVMDAVRALGVGDIVLPPELPRPERVVGYVAEVTEAARIGDSTVVVYWSDKGGEPMAYTRGGGGRMVRTRHLGELFDWERDLGGWGTAAVVPHLADCTPANCEVAHGVEVNGEAQVDCRRTLAVVEQGDWSTPGCPRCADGEMGADTCAPCTAERAAELVGAEG